ncbi:MAG: hypothetical protein LBF32_00280 [Streptococcaceae bacterium]|nr:hypothetical protein [Streptococcaceae bacterium]
MKAEKIGLGIKDGARLREISKLININQAEIDKLQKKGGISTEDALMILGLDSGSRILFEDRNKIFNPETSEQEREVYLKVAKDPSSNGYNSISDGDKQLNRRKGYNGGKIPFIKKGKACYL